MLILLNSNLTWYQEVLNFVTSNLLLIFLSIGLFAGLVYIIVRMIKHGDALSDIIGVNPQFTLEVIVFLTSLIEIVSMSIIEGKEGGYNQMLSMIRYSPLVVLEVMLSFYSFKTVAKIIADGKFEAKEIWDGVVALASFIGSFLCTRLLLWFYMYSIEAVTFSMGDGYLWGILPSVITNSVPGKIINPLIVFGIMCTPLFNGLAFLFMIRQKVFIDNDDSDVDVDDDDVSTTSTKSKKEKDKGKAKAILNAKKHIAELQKRLSKSTNPTEQKILKGSITAQKAKLKKLQGK